MDPPRNVVYVTSSTSTSRRLRHVVYVYVTSSTSTCHDQISYPFSVCVSRPRVASEPAPANAGVDGHVFVGACTRESGSLHPRKRVFREYNSIGTSTLSGESCEHLHDSHQQRPTLGEFLHRTDSANSTNVETRRALES